MRLPNYLKYNDEFRAIKSALPFVVIDKFNFPETEPILKELSESLPVSDNKRKRFILYFQIVLPIYHNLHKLDFQFYTPYSFEEQMLLL